MTKPQPHEPKEYRWSVLRGGAMREIWFKVGTFVDSTNEFCMGVVPGDVLQVRLHHMDQLVTVRAKR